METQKIIRILAKDFTSNKIQRLYMCIEFTCINTKIIINTVVNATSYLHKCLIRETKSHI